MYNSILLYRTWKRVAKRVLSMTAAWLLLGAALGACIGVRLEAGPVLLACHVIAGMIVCLAPGVVLGLFSARAKESLAGGAFGLVIGILNVAAWDAPAELADLCLVIGGLVGATSWPAVQAIVRGASRLRRYVPRRATAGSS